MTHTTPFTPEQLRDALPEIIQRQTGFEPGSKPFNFTASRFDPNRAVDFLNRHENAVGISFVGGILGSPPGQGGQLAPGGAGVPAGTPERNRQIVLEVLREWFPQNFPSPPAVQEAGGAIANVLDDLRPKDIASGAVTGLIVAAAAALLFGRG